MPVLVAYMFLKLSLFFLCVFSVDVCVIDISIYIHYIPLYLCFVCCLLCIVFRCVGESKVRCVCSSQVVPFLPDGAFCTKCVVIRLLQFRVCAIAALRFNSGGEICAFLAQVRASTVATSVHTLSAEFSAVTEG